MLQSTRSKYCREISALSVNLLIDIPHSAAAILKHLLHSLNMSFLLVSFSQVEKFWITCEQKPFFWPCCSSVFFIVAVQTQKLQKNQKVKVNLCFISPPLISVARQEWNSSATFSIYALEKGFSHLRGNHIWHEKWNVNKEVQLKLSS